MGHGSGQAGLWGAGDCPCCGIAGAQADGPGGQTRGPGQAGGAPRGDMGSWAGPASARRAQAVWSQWYRALALVLADPEERSKFTKCTMTPSAENWICLAVSHLGATGPHLT